jgi:site-specific recombinase XerC
VSLDERLLPVDAALASPESDRLRNVAIIQLLLHTPLDATDLAALDVCEVDTELHELLVAERGETIGISDLVAEALELYLAERADISCDDEQALLLSSRHTRMSASAIEALVIRLGFALSSPAPQAAAS